MTHPLTTNAPRSTFVTALAWIFIVLAGFSTFIAALQNVMVSIMVPAGMPPVEQIENAQDMPAFARFMVSNFRLVFASFLALSALTLAAAVGLLKRKNWARLTFIAIMGIGIAWNVGSVFLTLSMFSSMPLPDNAPAQFRQQHERILNIMIGATVAMAVAFSALFAWIIKRLTSRDVTREFAAA